MNKVVFMTVVKPEILPIPADPNEPRDMRKAYIDWISDDDKGYLLAWAFGGVQNLKQFRRELKQLGNGVDEREDVEASAERDLQDS
jgi:hypothetical protein